MKDWQSIMSEQFFDSDFELSSVNDEFVAVGIINSYASDTISDNVDFYELMKLLDILHASSFELKIIKNKYNIVKKYKDGFISFYLSERINIMNCKVYIKNQEFRLFTDFFQRNVMKVEPSNLEYLEMTYELLGEADFLDQLYKFFSDVYDKVVK